MRIIVWFIRAFVFFALFAFALNNQQEVIVKWFFGIEWYTPLVIVVLLAFAIGCLVGILAMTPIWWKYRNTTRRAPPKKSD